MEDHGTVYETRTLEMREQIAAKRQIWTKDTAEYHGQSVDSYGGWSPVGLTMLGNTTYYLWRYTDGTATIWQLDANLNFITSSNFGPVAGWEPEGLSVDGPTGNLGLVWHTPANQVSVWVINSSLNALGASPVFGPYFGWLY